MFYVVLVIIAAALGPNVFVVETTWGAVAVYQGTIVQEGGRQRQAHVENGAKFRLD